MTSGRHCVQAQKYNPSDPEIYQTMGRIIRMSGNIDLGITYLLSLTMTPVGTAPQIFISIAELLSCRGLSASEKYKKRGDVQNRFPLSLQNMEVFNNPLLSTCIVIFLRNFPFPMYLFRTVHKIIHKKI